MKIKRKQTLIEFIPTTLKLIKQKQYRIFISVTFRQYKFENPVFL